MHRITAYFSTGHHIEIAWDHTHVSTGRGVGIAQGLCNSKHRISHQGHVPQTTLWNRPRGEREGERERGREGEREKRAEEGKRELRVGSEGVEKSDRGRGRGKEGGPVPVRDERKRMQKTLAEGLGSRV
eukprot:2939437-Rhodomonas_salina.2